MKRKAVETAAGSEEVPPNWPHPEKAQHRTVGGKGEVGRLLPDKKRRKVKP